MGLVLKFGCEVPHTSRRFCGAAGGAARLASNPCGPINTIAALAAAMACSSAGTIARLRQDCGDRRTTSDPSRAAPHRCLLRAASPHASSSQRRRRSQSLPPFPVKSRILDRRATMRLFFYVRAYYNYNEIRLGGLANVRSPGTRETASAHSA